MKVNKNLLYISLVFALVLGAGAILAAVTYNFFTPQATVHGTAQDLTFTASWDKSDYIVGDTATLSASLTNPNSNYKFQLSSFTLVNQGTSKVKVIYDSNNYVILDGGQSMPIPLSYLAPVFPGGVIPAGYNQAFSISVELMSQGTLKIGVSMTGDWVLN